MLAPLVNIELKINSDDNDSNIEDNNNSDDMNGDNYSSMIVIRCVVELP